MVLRVIFWIGLALASSSFLRWGITAIFLVIAGLVALNFFVRGGREALRLSLNSLAEGAKNALSVGVACALVGVIIGVMTLTGAATTFGSYVIALGEHSLFLSLALTMVTCLVLGMGIPTIPNYIITSSLAAPALLEMGVPLIVSHMFVFYFGIMADLTPPVALAAFAASPIAKESGLKIGIQAMRIAIAGFVVPYMAVYAPALMLQAGTLLDTGFVFLKALAAIGLWGAASVGYLWAPMAWYERILAAAAAFLLVVASAFTDQVGFALGALVLLLHWRRSRRR
jgi:TRAP transporter 4TM/12TM fusion protein